MGFGDIKWEFWDAKALTGNEESRLTGEIMDLETYGAADAQMGFLWWNILVSTAENGTLTEGGYFQLVTSDSATFATGSGGEQAIACFGSHENPLFAAQLVEGARFSLCVPGRILHQYTEVEWRIVSSSAGALVIDSSMGMEPLWPLNTQKEPS